MGDDTFYPYDPGPDDTRRLNWLETQNAKNSYTGKCNFRWSVTGRGWRLMETSGGPRMEPTFATVREAIDYAIKHEKETTNENS